MNAKQAKALRRISFKWENGKQVVDRRLYRCLKKLVKRAGLKLQKDLGR